MSGRKKNRKHRQGQPPHELLNELSSLHELLGSDMEADIPLLDQVAAPASPSAGGSTPQPQQTAPAKPSATAPAPKPQPRPLEEADLPILFSPIDEELDDEYAPILSDADRELLRPLQDLPRAAVASGKTAETPTPTPTPTPKETQKETQKERSAESQPAQNADMHADGKPAARAEFQPGLFDSPRKPANPAAQKSAPTAAPAPTDRNTQASAEAPVVKPEAQADIATPNNDKAPATKATPAPQGSGGENPFLPAHIRARLTGGRVPRAEHLAPPSPQTESISAEAHPAAEPVKTEQAAAAEPQAPANNGESEEPSAREKLIEQLMAEQLPELERQLRANITALVDEIYPEQE
uniref:hypothetical protein n=1 Tax=Microbulbifer agarilyticus TaxID=260552 RepID=UPI000255B81F|nr:hypothetical protein [Microbulbifer agarilyticus]